MDAIRETAMLNGKELKSYVDKNGYTQYELPASEPNWNRVEHVSVLKEDADGRPLWWTSPGINWIWYGAINKKQALELLEALTSIKYDINEPYVKTGICEEKDGTAAFRLHR